MMSAIMRGYEQAWQEGAAQCGIGVADRSAEEQARLQLEINTDVTHVQGLATYIVEQRAKEGAKIGTAFTRARIWINRYSAVRSTAQTIACADMKYQWRIGGTVEHCHDCLTYDGRIHRGSVWRAAGAQPQSQALACHGYNCDCSLNPVTTVGIRANPGRPPRPTG